VLSLWLAMRDLGRARLTEIGRLVETFLKNRSALEAVTCTELERRIKDGTATILDVRPAEEYAAGHISSARSIPLTELRARIKEVPKKRLVIAYCRGPYCVFADQAIEILRAAGYRAFRLEGGFPDWHAQGGPIDNTRTERGSTHA
jgi:rhodanese-related sulfurtransferase